MFPQSDCVAVVEHNTLHYKAETNRALYSAQGMISKVQKCSLTR